MTNEFRIVGVVAELALRRKSGEPLVSVLDIEDLPIALRIDGAWSAMWSKHSRSFYVIATKAKAHGRRIGSPLLHRWLLDAPSDLVVDHINHDTLDNRRANLRLVTLAENAQNRRVQRNTRSGHRGVHATREGSWIGRVTVNGRSVLCRRFPTIEEADAAVRAVRAAAMPFSVDAANLRKTLDV